MISQQAKVQLIYIAGTGRSGSTILDSVLGNHPLVQSLGELARLPQDAWVRNYYCACGQRARNCLFWDAVCQEWSRENGGYSVQEYIELQDRFERLHRWPSLLWEQWQGSAAFRDYAEQTFMLLKAIQTVSGCAVIVDSSKGVERAFVLSLVPNVDLRLIQLVRDPRGVVWSHKKPFAKDLRRGLPHEIRPEPAWRVALYWCRANLQAEWLRRHVGAEKSALVRYEDFMLDPSAVLKRIGASADIDMADIERDLNNGKEFRFGHAVAGNRVRMRGEFKLKFDQEWTQKLCARDRQVTEILAGWLMLRYGYKL